MQNNESSRMSSTYSNTSRIKHKIIFLGDQHVGKTCIIERFMYDVFSEKTHPTVGVDFLAKTLHIDDKNVRLQLWDTAGQERFKSLIPSYLRDATCSVIVYDVTSKSSFQNVENWIKEYRDNRGVDAPSVLVGNKIDLDKLRIITEKEGKEKAIQEGMQYYEISAKTGENINEMFKSMAIMLQPNDGNVSANQKANTTQKNTAQKDKNGNQQQTPIKLGENKKPEDGKKQVVKSDNCC